MPTAGYWALVVMLMLSAYTVAACILGSQKRNPAWLESARNGALAAGAVATAGTLILVYLLLSRNYAVKYVYEHVSSGLSGVYRVAALWAGQEGSLLLWLWLVALSSVVVVLSKRVWGAPFGPYVLATMAFTQGFLSLVLLLASSPFTSLPNVPVEGHGLNPLLQNFWMVIHPPVVFVGYASYAVPFALAVGGLIAGRMEKEWLQAVRRWALFAWLFLGMGIIMGAWWAYLELGWGGYWGWDPVENSSLIPWLTGTALLHSLMMQQRRGAFKAWNLWLIGLTFLLCVLATFITRSGIVQSVHAFGRSAIGYYFVAFMGLCLAALVTLLNWRRQALGSDYEYKALLSREAGLLMTNLLFVGAALIVLVGTLFPALVEVMQGRQAALDASFYGRAVGPVALLIVILVGICPWLAWDGLSPGRFYRGLLPAGAAAVVTVILLVTCGLNQVPALVGFAACAFVAVSLLATFYRGTVERRRRTGERGLLALTRLVTGNRHRYGAHVVHLGIVFITMGVTGSSTYQEEVQIALMPGEKMAVQGYTLEYRDRVPEQMSELQRFAAVVNAYRGDRLVATLVPKKDFYWNVEQWVTEVAIHSTLKEDLYLVLAGLEQDGLASFLVLINPLVAWIWIGGAVLLLGGVMAWWPTRQDWNRT